MDDQPDRVAAGRRELVLIASGMLAGSVNLIEGMRRICALRFVIDDPTNEIFLPIRAMESETDSFPLGATRSNYSGDYLARADAEMERYLTSAREEILRSCREIIQRFS